MRQIPGYALLAVFSVCGVQGVRAESLSEILARMDKDGSSFVSMTATLNRVQHTAIIDEDDKDTATVRLKRSSDGLRGYVAFAEPNRRFVGFKSGKLQVYTPKTNTVEVYDLGKHAGMVDQFLLMGFGTSGKELQKSYKISSAGTETIGGKQATRLVLVPKSNEAKQYFQSLELWIPQGASYPVQEKIHKNEQDYILISYSDIKINPPLADKDLELRLPSGVRTVYPEK